MIDKTWNTAECNEDDGDEEKEAKPSFGLKFETAGTVQDYFATKMAALKAKRAAQLTGAEAQDETVAPQTVAQVCPLLNLFYLVFSHVIKKQVWPLHLFFQFTLCKKIIDLPGGQINESL